MIRANSISSSAAGPAMASSLLLCLCIAGCAVGPNFVRPQAAVPDAWVGATAVPTTQPSAAEADLRRWWTAFSDTKLTSLIEQAFRSNLDLRIATSRIRQARANRGIAVSGIGPTVDASGSFRRSQASAGGGDIKSPTVNNYQAGFDAGWEIDIFGGVRRGMEAADAELQATVENRRDVLVTLASEVARNYVDLRTYQQRLAIARKNLQAQKRSAELTRKRFEGGFVSGLDVANADALVATTEAQIPLLESSARQTIYALSVLLDREPGALVPDLSEAEGMPAAPPAVPIGVPSDLLRRRPDIRLAEADIHAATAQIGVATADLFPKVAINGSVGWQAANSGDLFDPLSRFWSFGPSVTWNVFQSGRTLSDIEVQKALQEQSILAYRKTVLTAIQEVENALIASAKEQERRKGLQAAVAANRKAADLATQLYTEGHTDFLNVLSAQRSLYSSEDAFAQSTQTMAVELIALYKALGGGWEEDQTVAMVQVR
jgi:NodT family efflux transporter outer membrane factor (OMF) lipoprotein